MIGAGLRAGHWEKPDRITSPRGIEPKIGDAIRGVRSYAANANDSRANIDLLERITPVNVNPTRTYGELGCHEAILILRGKRGRKRGASRPRGRDGKLTGGRKETNAVPSEGRLDQESYFLHGKSFERGERA